VCAPSVRASVIDAFLGAIADPPPSGVDGGPRIKYRHVGEIDIHRQARPVADEEVDGRAAFEGQAPLFGDQWKTAHEQRYLTGDRRQRRASSSFGTVIR